MRTINMKDRFREIRDKVLSQERLEFEDGQFLFESHDIAGIGQLADIVRKRLNGNRAYYVYNQHINYTNVCVSHCQFCAFAKNQGDAGAYAWTVPDIRQRILSRIEEPIRELHIVGGLNPHLPFAYYAELLESARELRPEATLKAFTAVELDFIAGNAALSVEAVIRRLKQSGLAMLPGGGAEVMSSRIHESLFPRKIDGKRWLDIMETAHGSGLMTNATLLYGHIETYAERLHHLMALRDLQDRTSGFCAFIPLAFHSANTGLSHLPATTAFDDLKTIAISRLMLDNFPHIKAYWVMIGEKLAQLALSFGADDLDGTIIEERISHDAGATSPKGLTRDQLKYLITSAGYDPVERDAFYRPVSEIRPAPSSSNKEIREASHCQ
jgi:aminodeoxyfutalosine synthase